MKEKDFLRLVKQADRRYFAEAAERAEQVQSTGEEYSMKPKKHKKFLVIAALAAALSVGGATAAVAMRGHNTQNQTTEHEETTPQQTEKPEIEEQKTLNLHLTADTGRTLNSAYSSSLSSYDYTESETGWYYRKQLEYEDGTVHHILYYTDKATGESVPLCTHPNCKHDGSLYCTATTDAYNSFNPIWANGSLWAITRKVDPSLTADSELKYFPSNNQYSTAGSHVVVLQIAPDGSSIKEVADLGECSGMTEPILYRGNLFCYIGRQIGETVTMENEITKNTEYLITAGYELIAFNIAEKQAVTVSSEMPDAGSNKLYSLPEKFCGIGDYIYQNNPQATWQDPYASGVQRVSLLTGKTEELVKTSIPVCSMSENGIVYQNAGSDQVRTYCPDTGEDALLYDPEKSHSVIYQSDSKYYYGTEWDKKSETLSAGVYDKEMKLLGSLEIPDHKDFLGLKAVDGRLYVTTGGTVSANGDGITHTYDSNAELLSCAVQDIIDGTSEWKKEVNLCERVSE